MEKRLDRDSVKKIISTLSIQVNIRMGMHLDTKIFNFMRKCTTIKEKLKYLGILKNLDVLTLK